MAISGLSLKKKKNVPDGLGDFIHDLARCRYQSGIPNPMVSPWDFDGPNRNRWFTELNSMVDLSMANCLLNNQMVLIMQFCDKAIVCFPRFCLSIPALGRCVHLSATQPDISYNLQFRQQMSVKIWLKGISGIYIYMRPMCSCFASDVGL